MHRYPKPPLPRPRPPRTRVSSFLYLICFFFLSSFFLLSSSSFFFLSFFLSFSPSFFIFFLSSSSFLLSSIIFFLLFKLLAGNPFGNSGGRYFAKKLVETNRVLRVLDIHNSDMADDTEREVIDLLRKGSGLHLLGSHFGRKDHRIIRVDGDQNLVCNLIYLNEEESREKGKLAKRIRGGGGGGGGLCPTVVPAHT